MHSAVKVGMPRAAASDRTLAGRAADRNKLSETPWIFPGIAGLRGAHWPLMLPTARWIGMFCPLTGPPY